MFGLSLKSMAITGAAGFIAGIIVATAATATFYEKSIVPGREAAAEQRATDAAEARIASAAREAAARAIAGELTRRQEAINRALEAYQRAHAADAAEAAARLAELEEENRRYANQLAETGKSCPLGDPDIDFLDPMRLRVNGL